MKYKYKWEIEIITNEHLDKATRAGIEDDMTEILSEWLFNPPEYIASESWKRKLKKMEDSDEEK